MQTSQFTLAIGQRECLVARGLCADADFPKGRKRIAWEPDWTWWEPDWTLTRRAHGTYTLRIGHRRVCVGGAMRDGKSELRAHKERVAARRITAASADELYCVLFLEYHERTKEPLALIEAAADVGQDRKPATAIAQLARRARIPAYLVLYKRSL